MIRGGWPRRRLSSSSWGGVLLLVVAGCGSDSERAEPLRLNDIQILASHNSYKEAIDRELYDLLVEMRGEERIAGLDYAHPPLDEQLDSGLRGLELDVFWDPDGGRYAEPLGLDWLAERGLEPDRPFDPEPLLTPGLKTLHVQDVDFRSNCATFRSCLQVVARWSDAHPGHLPVVVTLNAKDAVIEGSPYSEPAPFDRAAFAALDGDVLESLGRDRLILPDDVRGDRETLREAVLEDGWPTLDNARGRFLFVLDEGDPKRSLYLGDPPSVEGRVFFVNAPEDHPAAAFLIVNDPIGSGERIRSLVERGFLVRTRADADTREARSDSTERREAAFASGAHVVSTDYARSDPRFRTGYRVEMPGGRPPGGGPARCNPVRRLDGCALDEEP